MTQTATGAVTTSIDTAFTVPSPTELLNSTANKSTVTAIATSLASIKAGAVTFTGTKTFSAAPIFAAGCHVSQTFAITADGTGCTLAGDWTASGTVTFDDDVSFNKSPELSGGLPTFAVTGATNATPIVITVANHGLVDGQQVVIANVLGNTAANGTWVADVLSPSTLGLVGSAGSGAYTAATGTMNETAEIEFSAPRTVTRALSNFWNDGNTWTDSAWSATAAGVFTAINGTPTTQAQHCGFEIDVPQGANIISATIYMQPNSGHGAFPGGAPGTFPNAKLYRFTLSSGASTTLATGTDPNTGTAGAYEGYTAITATIGTDEIADRSRFRYMVILSTETGANALDGTRVFAGAVTYATSFLEQI